MVDAIGDTPASLLGSEVPGTLLCATGALPSNNDFLLTLSGGATAMLAVAIGVLTFLVGRAVARTRAHDQTYNFHLAAIVATAVYALACDALAWWSWSEAAGPTSLLFGWPLSTWLLALFVPPAVFSAVSATLYGSRLARRLGRDARSRWQA